MIVVSEICMHKEYGTKGEPAMMTCLPSFRDCSGFRFEDCDAKTVIHETNALLKTRPYRYWVVFPGQRGLQVDLASSQHSERGSWPLKMATRQLQHRTGLRRKGREMNLMPTPHQPVTPWDKLGPRSPRQMTVRCLSCTVLMCTPHRHVN